MKCEAMVEYSIRDDEQDTTNFPSEKAETILKAGGI